MIDIQEHTEPPRPHPVVIVKKMMRSAINGCNAAVLLSLISAGALCDLARLLRLRTGGWGGVQSAQLCTFVFCMCLFLQSVCVCVFSMFGMQSVGIPARLHERTRLVCDDDADGVCVCVCVCVCGWV